MFSDLLAEISVLLGVRIEQIGPAEVNNLDNR
jgi:hypothetical protein